MRAYLKNCKFNTCTHTHEPQCAVLAAVAAGQIAPERYRSYLSILTNEDQFN
jgi:ribosome biogenesis GTPase